MHTRTAGAIGSRLIRPTLVGLVAFSCLTSPARAQEPPDLSVSSPTVVLDQVPFSLTVRSESAENGRFRVRTASGRELASGPLPIREDVAVPGLEVSADEFPLTVEVEATGGTASESVDAHVYPGWASIIPPLMAIALALIFREVVVSLFFGVWIGGMMIAGLNPLSGLWRTVDTFVVPSLANGDHASIIIFSALLSAMVGVISRSGGTRGIVEAVRPMATTPLRGQLATFLAGVGIFFDDYANTLIVGNTFRPDHRQAPDLAGEARVSRRLHGRTCGDHRVRVDVGWVPDDAHRGWAADRGLSNRRSRPGRDAGGGEPLQRVHQQPPLFLLSDPGAVHGRAGRPVAARLRADAGGGEAGALRRRRVPARFPAAGQHGRRRAGTRRKARHSAGTTPWCPS